MAEPLNTQTSYDAVAPEYANRFSDEMSYKPFDRKMLDWLAEKVGDGGVICDLGCGPGQIARYLHSQGAKVCGLDLSPEMIAQAQRLNPEIPFQVGNMLALTDVPDNSYGGIAAFYCIIHIPRDHVVDALKELYRVLRPGGVLLVTFHIGDQIKHLDDWWEQKVALDFIFYQREDMRAYLQAAGFTIEEALERDPHTEVEVETRRAYIFARKAEA